MDLAEVLLSVTDVVTEVAQVTDVDVVRDIVVAVDSGDVTVAVLNVTDGCDFSKPADDDETAGGGAAETVFGDLDLTTSGGFGICGRGIRDVDEEVLMAGILCLFAVCEASYPSLFAGLTDADVEEAGGTGDDVRAAAPSAGDADLDVDKAASALIDDNLGGGAMLALCVTGGLFVTTAGDLSSSSSSSVSELLMSRSSSMLLTGLHSHNTKVHYAYNRVCRIALRNQK